MNYQVNVRDIPAVNVLLQSDGGQQLVGRYAHKVVVNALREAVDELRSAQGQLLEEEREGKPKKLNKEQLQEVLLERAQQILAEKFAPSLKKTINGTGTIIHTNLGRAKLSPVVEQALRDAAFSFSNLEYDLQEGSRGSRYQHLEDILCELTGAEAALVVNNNAAAIMLALDTIAKGKEVIVSRGELVEIGGSFRIPEIIELSGCRLKEVGTTNKTHPLDYQNAIGEDTAAILKVHTSNYKISGFTKTVEIDELSAIAHGGFFDIRDKEIPLIHDMGSGMFFQLEKYGLPREMTVMESLEQGADVVTFSGDKVLGGPQAGIIVGKKKYINQMKKNQLTRTLRVDKMTIATLEATLRLYYDEQDALKKIPTLKMLVMTLEELAEKGERFVKCLADALGQEEPPQSEKACSFSFGQGKLLVEVVDTYSQVGGGAYPGEEIKSKAIALSSAEFSANQLSEGLRKAPVPIISKIRNQKCELDLRTIEESEYKVIVETLEKMLG